MGKSRKYKVISCSETRAIHESKKAWLETQGLYFGDYDIKDAPKTHKQYWGGLNFHWCFEDPETATAFRLRWAKDE